MKEFDDKEEIAKAEQFFRHKAFPLDNKTDEEWIEWKHTHKGVNWQGFAINTMAEYRLTFDDTDRANYYEDKIDALNRILGHRDNEIGELKTKLENVANEIDKIFHSKIIDKEKNEEKAEILKYRFGLKSKYQPPTGYKFNFDDNEDIINQVVN